MSSISFFNEDSDFQLSDQQKTKAWILGILSAESLNAVQINYIFCSDKFLHKVNLDYLSHDTYTDIITFDQSEKDDELEGDIYISIERVKENSQSFGIPLDKELRRVMIHGILHLMGFSDKTSEEKSAMRKKEDSCLSLYFD